MFEKTLLYKKEKVVLTGNRDRRSQTDDNKYSRTDDNIKQRITKFSSMIKEETNLETNLNNLF